jgi:hypothetical protein
MIGVFKGSERIGSLLKVMAASRPWYAYANPGGRSENFKTRKEAAAWLEAQHEASAPPPAILGTPKDGAE